MPTTTGFEFGDVVLVPFPFTDQSTTKQRPAVVVSSAAYNSSRRDLLILAVTSQSRPAVGVGEAMVVRWREAGLLKPSALKPLIATVEQKLVRRRLGRLQLEDRQALARVLRVILGS